MGHRAASRGERCQTVREMGEKNICCCIRECRPRIPRVLRLHVGGSLVRKVARHLTRRVPLISGTSPPPPERDRAASSGPPSRSRRHASATRACAPAHRVVLRATPKSIGGGWAESRPRRGVAEGNASTVACGSRRGDVRGSPVDRARPLERRRRRFLGAGEVQTEACDAPAPQARDEMAESSAGAPRLQSRARAPHRATQGAMERAAELGVPPRKLRRRRELSESRERALSEPASLGIHLEAGGRIATARRDIRSVKIGGTRCSSDCVSFTPLPDISKYPGTTSSCSTGFTFNDKSTSEANFLTLGASC